LKSSDRNWDSSIAILSTLLLAAVLLLAATLPSFTFSRVGVPSLAFLLIGVAWGALLSAFAFSRVGVPSFAFLLIGVAWRSFLLVFAFFAVCRCDAAEPNEAQPCNAAHTEKVAAVADRPFLSRFRSVVHIF
jgi:hypothetical protein